jgi:hypothetical protein
MVDPERYWNLAVGSSKPQPPRHTRRRIMVERLPGGCTLHRLPGQESASRKQAKPPRALLREGMVERRAKRCRTHLQADTESP